ncbi:MAG: c-type cytochrome [Pseudomonadales bacterium]|nr:c-type cytochrome [Pseudomonadales bacterium]
MRQSRWVEFLVGAVMLLFVGCSESPQTGENQEIEEPGKQTYTRFCFSCHASGLGGAPRTGDAAAWAPRLEKGLEKMLEGVIRGLPPGMPARGMCLQCSDQELENVMTYMLKRSK